MYCTWEAAPLGWMWLVSCPGLLAPLWVRSFIWRDSRGVWRCCGDWKWKHCSRRLNEHDHPLHIMTAAHTLMLCTSIRQALANWNRVIRYSGTQEGHCTLFPRQSYKRVNGFLKKKAPLCLRQRPLKTITLTQAYICSRLDLCDH